MLEQNVAQSIQRTAVFLLENQELEGSWADYLPGFSSTGWMSGYVGRALLEAQRIGITTQEMGKQLQHTFGWLLCIQNHDGGWSWSPRVVTDTDSTANCLLFLLKWGKETPQAVIDAGVEALLRHQYTEDGGIHTYTRQSIETALARYTPYFPKLPPLFYGGWMSATNSVSGVTMTALRQAGLEFEHPALVKLHQYILANQDAAGYWPAYWWSGPLFSTFHCVEALAHWDEWPAMKRATAWVRRTQNADGGWEDGVTPGSTPFSTALAIHTLMVAGEWGTKPVSDGVSWLLDHQLEDGSWEAVPNQQVPHIFQVRPWESPREQFGTGIHADMNRFFTSATILMALVKFYEEGMFFEDDVVNDRIQTLVEGSLS